MSVPEILHRVREQIKRSASRLRSSGWDAFPPLGHAAPIPGLTAKLKDRMSPPLASALRASVDRILAGRHSAHGVDWPQRPTDALFPSDLWRLDPVTGALWPGADVFCFDVGYRHAQQIGDIKFIWDIHRLQFLQPLAAAVALWQDPRALAAIETAILSWARANPPFGGVGWNSGVELSLRAVTLSLVATLCGPSLSEEARLWIPRILAAHLYWLNRYPSLYSSANNHRVSEVLAEFVIASVLPALPGSAGYADHARAVLETEATRQFFADGTSAEQAPTYGAFAAEMFLVADLVGEAFGRPLAPAVGARLVDFAGFIGALGDANGRVPAIGDDDEVRIITLRGAREYAYPASIARAIAARFGVPPQVPASADAPELRDVFFGSPLPDDPVADGVHVFGQGGCTVLRETLAGHRLRLTIDHGPLGYLSIAAHGHADANSITLSLDDRDILVDPGTYLYHSGRAWRDWFRGTGSHSTVRLGGVDQSVISGPFNWSHKAAASLESVVGTGAHWAIAARHDGYVRRFGVEHWRRVAATPTGLAIEDKLLGPGGGAEAEVIFQLAPGLAVEAEEETWVIARQGSPVLRMSFSHRGLVATTIGGEEPGAGGWVSENFGDKVEAARLVWRGTLPAEGLRTTLTWG